jgi:cytochrome c oxidase subunit 4
MTTEAHAPEAEGQHDTHEHAHPGPGEYIKVAVILAVVTAVEVGAYYIKGLSPGLLSLALIVMMVFKFSMVALWFMHLRFDSPIFRRLFVVGIVLAFLVYAVAFSTLGLQHSTIRSMLHGIRSLFGG